MNSSEFLWKYLLSLTSIQQDEHYYNTDSHLDAAKLFNLSLDVQVTDQNVMIETYVKRRPRFSIIDNEISFYNRLTCRQQLQEGKTVSWHSLHCAYEQDYR